MKFTFLLLIFLAYLIAVFPVVTSADEDTEPPAVSEDSNSAEPAASSEYSEATPSPSLASPTAARPSQQSSAPRKSTVSDADNERLIQSYESGRVERWNDINICWNIFRHHTLNGGEQIPTSRTVQNKVQNRIALVTSGFYKIEKEGTPHEMLDVALYMHAGTEGALTLDADQGDGHIINIYMDNNRVLHLRDFGMAAERYDVLRNGYNWNRAELFVNLTPGRNRPGRSMGITPATPPNYLATDKGTYAPHTQGILEYNPAP